MGSKGMPCTYATICGKSDREEDRLILSDGDSDASAPSGCACLSTFSKNEEKKGPWADRERYLDCPLVELRHEFQHRRSLSQAREMALVWTTIVARYDSRVVGGVIAMKIAGNEFSAG
jgi:hypothetical protein